MESLLSIRNLKKYYATQKAVDDISFDIPKGSIFGLLGPNGAGKSTLLRMVTGIFYPDSGSIILEGHQLSPKDTLAMGYMPEERGLYKKMKVGEHLVYLAQLKGLSKSDAVKKSREWMERLGMETWWNKKVGDLSKGMSQKVQFVGTVVHNPKLLILDEPFSGLDPVNSNLLKEEIFRLSQNGTTIVFSTHRMEQVEEFCEEIVLINLGEKVLDGKVSQIKQDFKENIFEMSLEKDFNPLPDSIELKTQEDHRIQFYLKEGIEPNQVLSYFIEQHNQVLSYHEILPTLNEIFIRLVKDAPTARQFTN